MVRVHEQPAGTGERAIREKWGSAIDAGWQAVPNVLVRAQQQLGLDPVDVVVLLNLNLHWWDRSKPPYPRAAIIANRMGVSKRTVERRLRKLTRKGFIERLPARPDKAGVKVRPFGMEGLVQRLKRAAAIGLTYRAGGELGE